jgi:hypothetical protein
MRTRISAVSASALACVDPPPGAPVRGQQGVADDQRLGQALQPDQRVHPTLPDHLGAAVVAQDPG